MVGISETETVVKRILPYLERRGYSTETDLTFELPTTDGVAKKYVDITVTAGSRNPFFLIEAKRQSHKINQTDRKQAINYGKTVGVPFVAVTNGLDLELWNTSTETLIQLRSAKGGSTMLPHKSTLTALRRKFQANPSLTNLEQDDTSLPFRPALPLKQLNALFARCHSKIRTLEKDEDNAFADFSKLLFLRLLEEKADDADLVASAEGNAVPFALPYSTKFHELAAMPRNSADQVKTLVDSMIRMCRDQYGDVITSGLHIRQPATYAYLVTELSKVSFKDSGLDTKGAAFEYFVRATLKGKKLGQYFTPRQLVELMLEMVGRDYITGTVLSGESLKVLDPACGTGGFLVFLMKDALSRIDAKRQERSISSSAADAAEVRIKRNTFFGIDANAGVASSAKMNMIISGDGHTNILHYNSLSKANPTWSLESADCDLIVSNPPFGTSEADLPADDLAEYPVKTTKGQLLFLQKMVLATKVGGFICTVIDDGALNTDMAAETRRWMLENVRVRAVVSLPPETFKPNKISVKSSVLLLERFDPALEDDEAEYQIPFMFLKSLGFSSSGDIVRGFDFSRLKDEIGTFFRTRPTGENSGYHWTSFTISSHEIMNDPRKRLDVKYWDTAVQKRVNLIAAQGGKSIAELNLIETLRGKSPSAALYVDANDGHAMVLKAGSSVSSTGAILENGDWVEKAVYDELPDTCKVKKFDVLLSSTGDGTLGKSAVYDFDIPAIADGHITIIRVDDSLVDPYFLSDYLRKGFGRVQSNRLFAGSTGLIELTPEDVESIVVPTYLALEDQKLKSKELRSVEKTAEVAISKAHDSVHQKQTEFAGFDVAEVVADEDL
ncbi:N-6 DNA methylase [Arthrobacter sp. zg-Y40]|uniref:N-6 DNA methylase n=1 Tax=Arthrobacter sp. zg-Y40 TaxID=2886939 RepID=UPI001D14CB08|nr:N-6 DNA methylase [Arthrobacter sp. zg-Y40]MCC3280722.1 N-6 DNA methylase [Arthrobacter sp. zg-Y40]